MSLVHCAPEDAVCIHQDIRSKKSIGMHYGTIRGGLSGQYEEVTLPPRRFKEKAEEAGLRWEEEIGLCDVGETVAV
jgi:L-ascorbate metabolism protein UlaG (beta-lactamase superfamily)